MTLPSPSDKIIKQIREMPDIEKLKLVDSILRELDKPDPEIDKAWAEEAAKRWNAYREGGVKTIPYNQVMKKYRSR